MNQIICGTLKKRKKFYFSFDREKNILTIQPENMKKCSSWFLDSDFEDYPFFKERVDIEGETNYNTYIGFFNVKFSSIGRGCFKAWVPAYVLGKDKDIYPLPKPNLIRNISFKGECIDRFETAKRITTNKWNHEKKEAEIKIEYGEDKVKKFCYNGMNFSFVPDWSMLSIHKDVSTCLVMNTSLRVESPKNMGIKSILKLYHDVERLFSFVCYRRHVEFKSIILTQVEPITWFNETEDSILSFELHVASGDEKYDLPRIGKTMILEDYIDKIPELIKCVSNDEFILLSLPNNSLMADIIDPNKYISISAAFESEFDLLFPKFKSTKKKKYSDAKLNVLNFLKKNQKDKKYNSEERGYYKSFYAFFDRCEGTLGEQITHALERYSYIVDPDRKYCQKKYPDINFDNKTLSLAFSVKRDNLSHGGSFKKFELLERVSYSIIRKVNYAMVLERSGFNDKQIQNIINQIL